jgi:major type 1 subunit fimbrin (pilin)
MKRTLPAIALSLALGFAATAAMAADGTITITGAVVATTCDVKGDAGLGDGGVTPDIAVTLPHVSKSAFRRAGDVAAPKPFHISLTGCSDDTHAVRAYFHPAMINVDPAHGTLKNTVTGSDVQVQLLDGQNGDQAINLQDYNEADLHTVQIAAGNAKLIYWAQYYAPAASVSSGAYTTTLDYTIDYQ